MPTDILTLLVTVGVQVVAIFAQNSLTKYRMGSAENSLLDHEKRLRSIEKKIT